MGVSVVREGGRGCFVYACARGFSRLSVASPGVCGIIHTHCDKRMTDFGVFVWAGATAALFLRCRLHCEIVRQVAGKGARAKVQWVLTDQKSVNGTFINLTRRNEAVLQSVAFPATDAIVLMLSVCCDVCVLVLRRDGDIIHFGGGFSVAIDESVPRPASDFVYIFRIGTPPVVASPIRLAATAAGSVDAMLCHRTPSVHCRDRCSLPPSLH